MWQNLHIPEAIIALFGKIYKIPVLKIYRD